MIQLKQAFLEGAGRRKLDQERVWSGVPVSLEREELVRQVLLLSPGIVLNQASPCSRLCSEQVPSCPRVDELGTGVTPGQTLDVPSQRSHVMCVPLEYRSSSRAS